MKTECPFCGYDALEYIGVDTDSGDYEDELADIYECINCGAMVSWAPLQQPSEADNAPDEDNDWFDEAMQRAAAASQRDMLDLELRYQDDLKKSADNGDFDLPF